MGWTMEFALPDGANEAGHSGKGYLAMPHAPTGAETAPGVVVLHEWWGLNAHMRSVCDDLAAQGFCALAPDLYGGEVATDHDSAAELMGALDSLAMIRTVVRGAAQVLANGQRRVSVMGFCMGGAVTILAGIHVPEFSGAVCFYGIPAAHRGDPGAVQVPLMGHFAQHDEWCTPAAVDALELRLGEGGVAHRLHRYDAQHAFANATRPEVYDAEAAALAWSRTLPFLRDGTF